MKGANFVMEAAAFGLGAVFAFYVVWYILQVIADWKILSKAGKSGWLSLIPILNVYAEYDICWTGPMGLLYVIIGIVVNFFNGRENSNTITILCSILGVVAFVLHIIQSLKLSRSFGKGVGYAIFLIIFGPLARVILGLGSSEYVGRPKQ